MDFLKAFLPVLFASYYISDPFRMVVLAIMPTIGHIFPIWFDFKGGKGGAPFIGGALALSVASFGWMGFGAFLGIFVIFMAIVFARKITSVANLLFPWVFALLSWFYFKRLDFVIFAAIEGVIIAFALRENIKRLIAGNEATFEKKI
jgi:glycerol-3-phosphate acyltransferase PlsY